MPLREKLLIKFIIYDNLNLVNFIKFEKTNRYYCTLMKLGEKKSYTSSETTKTNTISSSSPLAAQINHNLILEFNLTYFRSFLAAHT